MTFQTVTVTWSEVDPAGNPASGSVTFQLTAPLIDGATGQVAETLQKTYFFTSGTGTSDALVANDSSGATPSGTAYRVTVALAGQQARTFISQVNHANGATQTLGFLEANAAVPAVQYAQYMPLPAGTPTSGQVPVATGAGSASAWGSVSGTGTVTSASVVTANGFAGTVATPTSTPAVTLETTVTGILKGNGTAVSAAAAGTDYVTPTGSGAGLTGITVGQVSGAAPLASPALTGTPTAPTATALTDSTQVATTAYADSAVAVETSRAETAEALLAPKASPTFTGTVTVPSTVNATDAAQKAYVDSVAQGLDNKPSVTALASSNITLSGTQTIDGVAVVAGNRVLATGQSTASQNGLWTVAAGAWTRPADFASGSTQLGASVFVEGGTSYGSSGWVLTGTAAVTVDTSSQAWTQFSGAGEITAGSGLSKSGNTLSVASSGVSAGSYTNASVTVGADGRVTAASSGTAPVTGVTAADGSVVIGGSSTAPTVRTGTLDAIAAAHPPVAAVAFNSQKGTGVANGTASGDIAAYGQTLAGGNGAPMTTLGDLLYENSTPAPARLAGNTTATKNFLTQTGTGSVSAAPAWGTIAAGDVPALNQNTTGTAANLSGTPALPNGTTATTQTAADNSTKLATTAYADNSATTAASGKVNRSGDTMTGYLAPDVATLTFVGSGTTLVNAALGNSFNLTLTASTTTLGNPSNPVDGQVIRFRITQGSGGSFTLAYGTAYDFGTAGAPTLSTSAGKVDILGFEYVASISKWCALGSALGL